MKNHERIFQLLNLFFKKSIMRFFILIFIVFMVSNNAYSFCSDVFTLTPTQDEIDNNTLCHYEEIEASTLPFCDRKISAVDQRAFELFVHCDADTSSGTCADCNLADCNTEKYYFVLDGETPSAFDVYVRDPKPGLNSQSGANCRGYLSPCDEVMPSRRISTNSYPESYSPNNANCIFEKEYCSSLDDSGNLLYPEGQVDDNCVLKSCVHLSLLEMEKIYNQSQALIDDSTSKKVFCKSKILDRDSRNLYKEYSSYENLPSLMGVGDLKCYNFSINQLEYVISLFNNIDIEGYCGVHECKRSSASVYCPNDQKYITSKGSSYIETYRNKILGGSAIEAACVYEERDCPFALADLVSCQAQDTPSNMCDVCKGIDRNVESDPNNCVNYGAEIQDVCDENIQCLMTADCGWFEANPLPSGADEGKYSTCDDFGTEETLEKDPTQSWYYRPIPNKHSYSSEESYAIPEDHQETLRNSSSCTSPSDTVDNKYECSDYLVVTDNRAINEEKPLEEYIEEENFCLTDENINTDNKITYSTKVTDRSTFSPPLCDWVKKGEGKTFGKNFIKTCDEKKGNRCFKSKDHSFYIRGTPKVEWLPLQGNATVMDAEVTMEFCGRFLNPKGLGVESCGKRECQVEKFFGSRQFCGVDYCWSLTSNGSKDCSLDGEDLEGEEDDRSCVKNLAQNLFGEPVLRVRINKSGRRVCLYNDVYTNSCTGSGHTNTIRRDSEKRKGRLDTKSLFDDNSLTDHNKDGIISDRDTYGEHLYEVFDCDNSSDERCSTYKIRNHTSSLPKSTILNIFGGNWITWDIIQYIGNNQNPKDNPNCDLSNPNRDISKCRGFYDRDGNFHQEQQCYILPLSVEPPDFYKTATMINTPHLFLPMLFMESAKEGITGNVRTLREDPNVKTDFFEPEVGIRFGSQFILSGLEFGEDESKERTIETLYNLETIENKFKLKKIGSRQTGAKICLYKILEVVGEEGEEETKMVQCVDRMIPPLNNFILKSREDIKYNDPKVEAYFSKNKTYNISEAIDVSDKDNFIQFMNQGENEQLIEYLVNDQNSEAEGHMIYTKKSFCSKLYSECVDNMENLYKESQKTEPDANKLRTFRNIKEDCDAFLTPECNKRNGNPKKFLYNNAIAKVKENNYAYGAYNEICIERGFEKELVKVAAFKEVDGVKGKCILEDESKQKSDCRYNEIWEYCEEGTSGCLDIDGLFVRKINCNCSGVDCLTKPEICFKGGFNRVENVFMVDGEKDISCKCKIADNAFEETTTLIARYETPREAGLCMNLPEPPVCEEVNYKNELGQYEGGGDGKVLAEVEKDHKSHIWRTAQKILGKFLVPFKDNGQDDGLGHAEFSSAIFCGANADVSCLDDDDNYIVGECKGFWKEQTGLKPMAMCEEENDNYMFRLKEGTGCERYTCPEIRTSDPIPPDDEYNNNYGTSREIQKYKQGSGNELESYDADPRGKNHGFALWDSYTKTNDDIECARAKECITGFGPAGTNFRLEKYLPIEEQSVLLKDKTNEEVVEIAEKLIGNTNPDKDCNVDYGSTNDSYHYINDGLTDLFYNLPVRYCNQIGNWMLPEDIYSKGEKEIYYINSNYWSDENYDAKGIVLDLDENNQSYKYCERLYCPAKTQEQIVPLYMEGDNPAYTPDTSDHITYTDGNRAYIGDQINPYTFWRHTGGAVWPETPATKVKNNEVTVRGKCENSLSFYTYDTEFLSTFTTQLEELKRLDTSDIVSLKKYRLATSTQTQPTRKCNHLGLWSPIENKCVKSCEMLDMYHTLFVDLNGDGKINSDEIEYIARTADEFDADRIGFEEEGGVLTGGAKWPRALGGNSSVVGKCDSTSSDSSKRFAQVPYIEADNKAICFEDANSPDGYSCPPVRSCSLDGTWETIQNACKLFKTCSPVTLTNVDIFGSAMVAEDVNGNKKEKPVITWDGGDLQFNNTLFPQGVYGQCNAEFGYKFSNPEGIVRVCNTSSGNWENVSEFCEPMTCGAYIDSKAEAIANLPTANTYVVKETGLKNYTFSSSCASNYMGTENVLECKLKNGVPTWSIVSEGCYTYPPCSHSTPVYDFTGTQRMHESLDDFIYEGGAPNFSRVASCRLGKDKDATCISDITQNFQISYGKTVYCADSCSGVGWTYEQLAPFGGFGIKLTANKAFECSVNDANEPIWLNQRENFCVGDPSDLVGTGIDQIAVPSGVTVGGTCDSGYTGSKTLICSSGEWITKDTLNCKKNCPKKSYFIGCNVMVFDNGQSLDITENSYTFDAWRGKCLSHCRNIVGLCTFDYDFHERYFTLPASAHGTSKTWDLVGFIVNFCPFTADRTGYFYVTATCNDGKWTGNKVECKVLP